MMYKIMVNILVVSIWSIIINMQTASTTITLLLLLTLVSSLSFNQAHQDCICPVGYSKAASKCLQKCLTGWRDDGLFCRLPQYGRGVGFPWKFADGLNDKGMFKRCQAQNGKDKCQKWGLIVYPKCKPGFSAFGCCICRPETPDCAALGYGPQIDLSCSKKTASC